MSLLGSLLVSNEMMYRYGCTSSSLPFSVDPIISQSDPREMTGYDPLPANDPDQKALSMDMFVVPRGGAYLFVPSINLLRNFSEHLST